MKIKELLCVGSLAASILTAGCFDNSDSHLLLDAMQEKESVEPFDRSVRFFYVEDSDSEHSIEAEAIFRKKIKKSQEFFANEMEKYGHGRRTFQLATEKIETIHTKYNEEFYLDDQGDDPRAFCKNPDPNLRPKFNRLFSELANKYRVIDHQYYTHVYIIAFPFQCGILGNSQPASFGDTILIEARNNDFNSVVLSHELGHIYISHEHDENPNNFMHEELPRSETDTQSFEMKNKQANIIDKRN